MTKNFFDFGDVLKNDRFLIGFDDIFKRLSDFNTTVAKNVADTYPPFNIKKIDENHFVLEVAAAGFGRSDIDVQIDGGTLTISGKMKSDGKDEDYLYRGIAGRAFTRSFSLADTVQIKDAELFNGLLKVYFENLVPLANAARKIEIK